MSSASFFFDDAPEQWTGSAFDHFVYFSLTILFGEDAQLPDAYTAGSRTFVERHGVLSVCGEGASDGDDVIVKIGR